MTLTYLLFSIAPPLASSLLPSLLPFPVFGRCFRTWVLTTYRLFYLSLSLRSFAPTSVPLPSTFRKLAGMTLPSTWLSLSFCRGILVSFLCCCLYLSGTKLRPNLPFVSAASNAILKLGGLLRWKERLVKDARLLRPLTKVMKIARLTSLLLDAPRQSSRRLRHGRRLALLFHPDLTRKLYTLFFTLSLALLPRLPPLQTFPTVLLPGNWLRSTPLA